MKSAISARPPVAHIHPNTHLSPILGSAEPNERGVVSALAAPSGFEVTE